MGEQGWNVGFDYKLVYGMCVFYYSCYSIVGFQYFKGFQIYSKLNFFLKIVLCWKDIKEQIVIKKIWEK